MLPFTYSTVVFSIKNKEAIKNSFPLTGLTLKYHPGHNVILMLDKVQGMYRFTVSESAQSVEVEYWKLVKQKKYVKTF